MNEAPIFNKVLNIFNYCPKCRPNQEPIGSIEIIDVLSIIKPPLAPVSPRGAGSLQSQNPQTHNQILSRVCA